MRPRRLKLGTHMDSGQMYHVYRNPAAAACSSLYFFITFLSNFQTLKFFITLLSGTVRPRRLKLSTHVDSGWMYHVHVYQNQAAVAYSSHYFSFFLSPIVKGTVRPRRLKLGAQVDNGWICRVYRNQAAAVYLSIYFFIFLSNF